MKKLFYFLIILTGLISQVVISQAHFEVVWEKDLFPTDIQFAEFSPDGKWIYCAIGANIKKMDAMTGEFVSTFANDKVTKPPYDMIMSPDGLYIVTDNQPEEHFIWDVKNEKVLKPLKIPGQLGNQLVSTTAFTGDGKTLLTELFTGTSGNVLKLELIKYNYIDDKIEDRVTIDFSILKLEVSHDSKTYITGNSYKDSFTNKYRNKLTLWDATTFKKIRDIEDVEGDVEGYKKIQYSMDDKFVTFRRSLYHTYSGYVLDLQTSTVQYKTRYFMRCSGIELLPDTSHFVVTEFNQSNNEITFLETFKIPDIKIDSLKMSIGGNLCSTKKDGVFYLFNTNSKQTTLLRQNTTSVKEPISDDFKFNITPDLIEISVLNTIENIKEIKIIDINGKQIYKQANIELFSMEFSIPNNFRTGTYFLILATSKGEYSHKFQVLR